MADSFEKLEAGRFYHIYNRGINSCNLFDGEADYKHFLELYERYIDPIAITYAWTLLSNHFHCLVKIKENIRYKYTMEEIAKEPNGLALNKWATFPLPDGVNDPSALKGNVAPSALKGNVAPSALKGNVDEAGENDDPSTFRGVDDIHSSTLSGTSTRTGFGRQSDDAVRLPNPTKHFSHLFNAYAKYYNTKNNRHGALFERPFKRKLIDSEDYLKRCIIYIHNNPKHHGFVSDPLEYSWSSYHDYLWEENKILKECVKQLFGDITNFKYCHKKSNNDF